MYGIEVNGKNGHVGSTYLIRVLLALALFALEHIFVHKCSQIAALRNSDQIDQMIL
jgi:hypothetical protein